MGQLRRIRRLARRLAPRRATLLGEANERGARKEGTMLGNLLALIIIGGMAGWLLAVWLDG
jgi:hypothetical protein